MTFRAALVAVLAALAVMLPGAASGAEPEPIPSRLLVTAREYSLSLSRPKLPAGPAIVQLYNYGEDPHDLSLRRAGTERIFALDEVGPGATGSIDLRLRRKSRYRLWCAIPSHAELGMTATLKTKAKRPRRH